MSAVALNPKVYRRELAKAMPRPIENDTDLEEMTAYLLNLSYLMEEGKATAEQEAVADVLATLIGKYEDEHYPVISAPPHERLAAILEHRGLTQTDLAKLIGKTMASLILSGKRAISKGQMKILSEHLRVPADLFL